MPDAGIDTAELAATISEDRYVMERTKTPGLNRAERALHTRSIRPLLNGRKIIEGRGHLVPTLSADDPIFTRGFAIGVARFFGSARWKTKNKGTLIYPPVLLEREC